MGIIDFAANALSILQRLLPVLIGGPVRPVPPVGFDAVHLLDHGCGNIVRIKTHATANICVKAV